MESMKAEGRVEVALVSPDRRRRVVAQGHNTLLYRCADAVARLFAGESAFRPTVIGFVYGPESAAFSFTSGRTTKTQDDLVKSPFAVHDIPIETGYSFAKSSSDYSGNAVTFRAMTADNDSAEYIHGFLLKDASGRILAVKKLDSAIQRTAGYAMAATWTVTFS